MRKLFCFLFVILLGFTSCSSGSGADSTTGIPKRVAITDADGLFRQTASSAPSGMPGRFRAPGAGEAVLMKAVGSETHQAVFTDSQGQEVTVDVDYSRKLGSDYLYIQYSHEEEPYYAVASFDSGTLREIKRPDDESRLREYKGSLYYISDNVLYKLDLATLDYTVRSEEGDGLSSSSYVFVSPSTDNIFLFAQNNHRCYYSGGTTYKDNSGSSSCELFYLTYQGDYARKFIVEDRDTAEIYYIDFSTTGIKAFQMEFDQPGYIGSVMPKDEFEIAADILTAVPSRVGDNTVYFDNSLFVANSSPEILIKLSRIGSENLDIEFFDNSSAEVESYSNPANGKYDTSTGKLILSYSTGGVYKINCRDVSGASLIETEVVSSADAITACCVAGDNVYYSAAGKAYAYSFNTGLSVEYNPAPVEVEVVTE